MTGQLVAAYKSNGISIASAVPVGDTTNPGAPTITANGVSIPVEKAQGQTAF